MLRGVDLTKRYQVGDGFIQAVSNLTLQLPGGRTIALVGRSGSGKSTLLRLLAGLETPTAGRLLIDEHEVGDDAARLSLRRGKVGFVAQDYNLVPELTARENVQLACELAGFRDAERVEAALDRVGLKGLAGRWPRSLSGGEQQRVAIARSLAVESSVLLADEPTGALDEDNARSVMDAFQALAGRGGTVLIATHDPIVVDRADLTWSMRSGKLITA